MTISSSERQPSAATDAAVLEATGDYGDFDDLVRHISIEDVRQVSHEA